MRRACACLVLLAATACDPQFQAVHVAALEDAVLAVDDELSIARVVRVDADSIQTTDLPLTEGRAALFERPGAIGEIVVLTQGELGDADEEPVPSEIVAIDRDGLRDRWPLEGQYASAALSHDGRYLAALAPRGRLVVENRVEVVDLTEPAGDANPVALSLRSLGGEAPAMAVFSSPLPWTDGADLRLAALFAAGQLSLFDLDAPDLPPITIPTTADGSMVGPEPVEGVFVGTELVLRSESSQLLVVSIHEGEGAQRFDVSVRTLAASSRVTAMEIDLRPESPRVIALSDGAVHLFDLATGVESALETPRGYREVVLFEGPAPGDPTSRARLALYGSAASITFVELGDGPAEVIDASTLALRFAPASVVADATAGRLVAFEAQQVYPPVRFDAAASAGKRPVSVIDLFDRSAVALEAAPEVSRAVVATERGAMWIASTEGYVSRFDLDSHQQRELWLDDRIESLLPLPGSSQRVLAFHASDPGSFTVLEAEGDPRRVSGVF